MLASFDTDRDRIRWQPLNDGEGARWLSVAGIEGHVIQFRWLSGGAGFVVATQRDVYLLALDGAKLKRAVSIFGPKFTPKVTRIWDTRVNADGVLVRYDDASEDRPGERLPTTKVAFAQVRNGTFHRFIAIDATERADDITAATVLAGGRVLVAEVMWDGGHRWIRSLKPLDGAYVDMARRECVSDACFRITNWSPGADKLVYSDSEGDVLVERAGAMKPLPQDPEAEGQVDNLWLSTSEDRVVASRGQHVQLWNIAGKRLWSVKLPGKPSVQSLKFGRDDKEVWAALGTRIYRINGAKSIRTVVHRRDLESRVPVPVERVVDEDVLADIPTSAVFLDDVVPLPDGGLAYAVVRLKRRIALPADLKALGLPPDIWSADSP